ncbi:MAG TPA: DUF2092 domain-containing protein [Microbacterium sp.]|nr:DUF2092 domain-containing protein [Microbacterium sp.]
MSPARPASHRRALAWTAALSVPVLAGAAVLVPMAASGAVDLPDKTVEELLEFAAASDVDALSGTVEQTSELGLPDLGALMGSGDDGAPEESGAASIDDFIALATGTHTANVFLDGDRARLQVLDQLAERNVYIDGDAREAWFVDSETQTATRFTPPSEAELEQLKAESGAKTDDAPTAEEGLPTPDQMLDDALARLDETTEVTVGTDARVAGRDVYELILEPRTGDTLIGDIRFAIDGRNGTALAASVTARGADQPAFEVAFTKVSFEAPDAAALAFTPGDDIAVVDEKLPLPNADEWGSGHAEDDAVDAERPAVAGEGWSAVVELPATGDSGDVFAGLDAEQRQMLEGVTSEVDGGRVLQTSLVTVLITDDGRVLAGAVPADRLVEVAQAGR